MTYFRKISGDIYEERMRIYNDIELFLTYHSLLNDYDKQKELESLPNFEERFKHGAKCWGDWFGGLWI